MVYFQIALRVLCVGTRLVRIQISKYSHYPL